MAVLKCCHAESNVAHHWIWEVLGYVLVLIKSWYPFFGLTLSPDKVCLHISTFCIYCYTLCSVAEYTTQQACPFDLISAIWDNGIAKKGVFSLTCNKIIKYLDIIISISLSFWRKNKVLKTSVFSKKNQSFAYKAGKCN